MIAVISQITDYVTLLLDLIGAVIVVYGSTQAFFSIFIAQFRHSPKNSFELFETAKRVYVQKLIFALDFFVAADLLKLISDPEMSEIVLIAIIVIIRTMLNYSLGKELKDRKK